MNSIFKSLLCLEILGLGILGAIAFYVQPSVAQTLFNANGVETRENNTLKPFLLAQNSQKRREIKAFFSSSYDYWDARVLADFWGQSVYDSKARIGRKILWGKKDVAILEQFLVDARIKHLQAIVPASTPASYTYYQESGYTYADAEVLAKFWGDASPMDTKLRIERNLTLGNSAMIQKALSMARK
jgi:hypothetical protein